MPEKNEEREQRRHRERRKEQGRRSHGEHNHHAAHRRRSALCLMARRTLLANALPVFQTVQKREKVYATEKDNSERCHDGHKSAQLRRKKIYEMFHQCTASSPVKSPMISSIFIPREPLKRTVSPSASRLLRTSAASACVST